MQEKQRQDELADALRRMSEQPLDEADISSGALRFDSAPLDENIPLIKFEIPPQDVVNEPVLDPSSLPDEPLALDAPGKPRSVPPNIPPLKPSAAPPPVKAVPSLSNSGAFVPPAPHDPKTSQPQRKPKPKRDRPHAPVPSAAPVGPAEPQQAFTFRLPAPRPTNRDDEDDSVIVPAPSPDSIIPHVPPASDAAQRHSLIFRRTMIPILLTCGLLLVAMGLGWFVTDRDSVIRTSGVWLPVTFLITGAILLFLAVLNMAQVRHLLMSSHAAAVR